MADTNEIHKEIKLVLEMTARVDERVKLVVERQSEMTNRLNNLVDSLSSLSSRVFVLEAKGANGLGELKNKYEVLFERLTRLELDPLEDTMTELEGTVKAQQEKISALTAELPMINGKLEKIQNDHTSAWAKARFVFDLLVKAGWAVTVGWLLWKLGLSSPHSPPR